MGLEPAPKIGSSAAAFRWIRTQFESKRDQTLMDPSAESGEACVAGTVTGQLAPETPFDEAYCHRAGHRSVGNHRL